MSNKQIYKPKPVSGFPEWLPEIRIIEQQWFDHIRRVFESYGFCSIETPSVEELDVLRAKGEVDKEIYVLERLHADPDEKDEARLALHFDQTVPLARYVAQNFNDLTFPFKRYQIQRVWRGERPQAGRFREFYQCDIDVINVDHLPLHFDAEMPAIIWEILSALPGMKDEKIQLRISNRKILMGLMENYGITSPDRITEYTRLIDKLEKIGTEAVLVGLKLNLRLDNLDESLADDFITLASLKTNSAEEIKRLNSLNQTMSDGIKELAFVLDQLSHLPEGAVVADLSIVRGLDYYTGIVYETVFTEDPGYGSICSGGRYDDLAGSYINKHLPGVGISIGFSRLFDRLYKAGKFEATRKSPADILVTLTNEEDRSLANETARKLRANGHNVEVYHMPRNLKKQLPYAEKKGIPYVWILPYGDDGHIVKDMNAKTQVTADPQSWTPEESEQQDANAA